MGIEIRTTRDTSACLTYCGDTCAHRQRHGVELVIDGVIFKTSAPNFDAALRIVQVATNALNIGEPGRPNYSSSDVKTRELHRPNTEPVPVCRHCKKPTNHHVGWCSHSGW